MDQLSTFAGLGDARSVDRDHRRAAGRRGRRGHDPALAGSERHDRARSGDAVAPPEVVVEWAVTDDRVLIGVGDPFVERALGLDAAGSLAETAGYSDAVADLGGSSNAGVTWIDLRGLRLALETAIGEMDPSGMEMYETEIAPLARARSTDSCQS